MLQLQRRAPRTCMPHPFSLMHIAPKIVLDTNVILDELVFKNAESKAIFEEVCAGNLSWVASTEMREELMHVLARGLGPRWLVSWKTLSPRWFDMVHEVPAASLPSPAHWPRCTDTDDQKFIDLALSENAQWLLSRDRAVLKTASRCRSLGLEVLTPGQWLKRWLHLRNSHACPTAPPAPSTNEGVSEVVNAGKGGRSATKAGR